MASDAAAAVVSVRDPSGIWRLLQERFERRLPLSDIAYKDATGSVRRVLSLPLQMVLEPTPHTLQPLLSLLLFRCEDSDAFRRQKVLIDGFLADEAVARQSWIVVQVALGGGSDQSFVSVPGRSLSRARACRRAFERLEAEYGGPQRLASGGSCTLLELFESNEEADRKQWVAHRLRHCCC